MATTYYNDIQKLYVAYFNRPGDPAGLAFWEKAVEASKGSTAVVAAEFAKQAEYTAAYKDMTNAQIVNQVYVNLFGRTTAGDTGADFWIKGLENKVISIADVVTAVAAGAQGTDKTAFNNKVAAAASFTNALDTDAEKAGYAGDAANMVAKTFLAGITTDATFAAATTPTKLNATVAAAVSAGTPFTVAGALAQVAAAQANLDAFVKATATTDVNLDGVKNAADITAAQTKAVASVAGDMTGGAAGATGSLFTTTTSQVVRDALVAAQQATNAAALEGVQKTLSDANADIAEVAGLNDAISAVSATLAAQKAAVAAEVVTHADILAKEAAFGTANGGTYVNNGTTITFTPTGGSAVVLADIANNKATLHTGVDATKYVGLTEVIASYNAEQTAVANVNTATANVNNAQLAANLLDVAPDANGTVNGTALTEKALIAAIVTQINQTTPDTVAADATPTVAQIQTELAVLKATDMTKYTAFKALVDAETAGLSSAQATANGNVTTLTNTLNTDKGLAATAHTDYTTQVTTFVAAAPANTGTVSVSGNSLILTNGATVTVLADLNATTKVASAHAGTDDTSNPGVSTLITKYNADINAAATVATDTTNLTAAKAAAAGVASLNPLTAVQAADAAAVTAANDAITKLAKDVAALATANTNANALTGNQATVDAYNKVLVDKGYAVVTLDAGHATNFAGANSDIYLVKSTNASIGAFGLQGTDALFVGSGYSLVQGAIGATGVKGSDAALEIFVSSVGGNTVLQVETHAYSSSVVGGTGEIVTITLTGVDASHIKLDSTGIITAPAA